MHTRAVTCRMCKSKFFPASLKFHTKVCAEKQDHIDLPCDYCQEKFPQAVLQTHMKTCTRDCKKRAQTTRGIRRRYQDPRVGQGQRSAEGNISSVPAREIFSARRQQNPVSTPLRVRKKGTPMPCSSHACKINPGPQQPIDIEQGPQRSIDIEHGPQQPIGIEPGPQQPIKIAPGPQQPIKIEPGPLQPIKIKPGAQQPIDIEPGPQQPLDDGEHSCHLEETEDDVVVTASDGRVACSNCNRWFSADRVAVHQEICQRVNTEESKGRRHTRRTIKAVGSTAVRSTKQRPSFSASCYSAGRRREAQELQPGRAHNQRHRAIDESETLITADTYSAPRITIPGQTWGTASVEPRASSRTNPMEKMKKRERGHVEVKKRENAHVVMEKRESGHHRWSQTKNRRPSGGACRGVAQQRVAQERPRPSSAVGWVSSAAKPVVGEGREASTARDVSSTWSPVRLGRGASVTVWSTRGIGRAARYSGGGNGGGSGDGGGHPSGGRRHNNAVRDVFSRRDIVMTETGDACERAGNRCDVRPQTAFFAPSGARRKIPFI